MLGIDFHLLTMISIQTHIIACLSNKINPLFQKILPVPGCIFCRDLPHNPLYTAFRRRSLPGTGCGQPISAEYWPSAIPTVKSLFFSQFAPCGKNHSHPKSEISVEIRHFFLCEPKMNIHTPPGLWKTPVENPVENVENC